MNNIKPLDLSWINDEIDKLQKKLSELPDDKTFELYKELISIRREFIEQYRMLLDIRDRMIIPTDTKTQDNCAITSKNKTAYQEFLEAIDSPTFAKPREIKEGFGAFKKRKRKREDR